MGWAGLYEVSDLGRVRSLRSEKVMSPGLSSNGYLTVNLTPTPHDSPSRTVHRLVCEAFHGASPEPNSLVRHLNDNKTDNRATNLAWGTYSDNWKDAVKNGRVHLVEECHRGHRLEGTNLLNYERPDNRTERVCRECNKLRVNQFRGRSLGKEPPSHGTRYAYIHFGCRCDRCSSEMSRLNKESYLKRKERANA